MHCKWVVVALFLTLATIGCTKSDSGSSSASSSSGSIRRSIASPYLSSPIGSVLTPSRVQAQMTVPRTTKVPAAKPRASHNSPR